ncbi:MAG: hypothetical protein JNM63_05700, partial [Spirochaetia bacterium]|nr:hypothetical protein [Spirochaetia bacterium]
DSVDQAFVAGKTVAARHVGANFFPSYALDHHGYMNVGYMVICLSNAAILHFDARRENFPPPESLTHHLRDLWEVVRGFLFADGRLARLGGDTRVRYAYCQEYILPVLLYAADVYQDAHALALAQSFLNIMETEQRGNPAGLFFEKRLAPLALENPYYYTRLESDRACVLAMLCNYLPLVNAPAAPKISFSVSAKKDWREDEHGAVMTRNEKRFASFSWRAQGLAQALCLPPERSDLAEWNRNLTPVVGFIGKPGNQPDRRLIRHSISSFNEGFITSGLVVEGTGMNVEEGGAMTDQAATRLAFAALPDGQTCVGFQYVVTSADKITYTTEIKSLHLNIPNDLFN